MQKYLKVVICQMETSYCSYVILYEKSLQKVWVVRYFRSGWLWLIWGRGEAGESSMQALEREVYEELWISNFGQQYNVVSVKEDYSFIMPQGRRSDFPQKHKEVHHLYVAFVSNIESISFKEDFAQLIWMDVWTWLKEISYPDFKRFIVENVLPILKG